MPLSTLRQQLKRNTQMGRHLYTTDHFWEVKMDPLFTIQVALLQYLEMAKDFVDTFKPYKTKKNIIADLTFIFLGLRDIINAIPLFAVALLSPVFLSMELLFSKNLYLALIAIPLSLIICLSTLVLATSQLLRGLLEVCATPLVLLRIPFRSLLTWHTGWPKFEDNQGLNIALNRANDCLQINIALTGSTKLEKLEDLIEHLNHKAIKAKSYAQYSQLRLNWLPHVDSTIKKAKLDFGLALQNNSLFLDARQALKDAKRGYDPKLRVKKYLRLFKPALDEHSDPTSDSVSHTSSLMDTTENGALKNKMYWHDI